MASLILSLLPSTYHPPAAAVAQPCFSLKPIIFRMSFLSASCVCCSSFSSPFLSIFDNPPLSEHREEFTSLLSYFQTPEEYRRAEQMHFDEGVSSSPASEGNAIERTPQDESDSLGASYTFKEEGAFLQYGSELSFVKEKVDAATDLNPLPEQEDRAWVLDACDRQRVSEVGMSFSGMTTSGDAVAVMIASPSHAEDKGRNPETQISSSSHEADEEGRIMASRKVQELELAKEYMRVPQAHWAALLRGLCENDGIDIAIKVLNWIRKCRLRVVYDELFSIVIDGLGRNGRFPEALSFADQLELKGAQMYNALLGACWINHDYSRLRNILRRMRKDGLKPDIVNYTLAIHSCGKEKVDSRVIVELYEDMLKDHIQVDEKLYNDVTFAVSSAGNAELGLRLLQDMQAAGFIPCVTAYTQVMFALGQVGRMDEVEEILEEMQSRGRIPKVKTYNTIIRGYTRKGQLDRAEGKLQFMIENDVERNERTYSLLIDACVKAGRLEKARALFKEMKAAGLQPTAFIYGRLMAGFKAAGQWLSAIKLLRKMQQVGVPPNLHVFNITIDAFGKHRMADKALEAFRQMRSEGIQPDVITWNSLIECHFRASQKEKALQLFSMMKSERFCPNRRTYNILIDWLGKLKCWDDLKDILEDMKRNGLIPNSVTYTTLVDVYGQSGRFQDAYECLEIMRAEAPEPVPSVYCALANAYAQQGLSEQAVSVFKRMEADGIKANLLMLNSILNSFSVAAKADEALSVFNFIIENGMTPDLVTHTTLMKAYINAEKFDEAVLVFERMIQAGVSPDKKAKDMRRFITRFKDKDFKPELT